ncbi:conserved exported protein of unknown function [Nitrospira japonica]|uniref:Ricin B lectin domain-containing protein n=2 Tax=Nitrospira japonica TaxID=1325564 RepID=A0A1W1I8R3_9BACT|nr:conserved exported protein of unknown function [Nitrospira japonica]
MRFHQTPSRLRQLCMAVAWATVASGLTVAVNFADDPPPVINEPSPTVEATPPIALPNEPPAGDVQERGLAPRVLQPGLEFKQMTPSVPPNPPAFGTLPGEFAIRSYLQSTPFTARDGGHHSIDAVITVPSVLGPNQRFRLASVQPDFTTIQTSGGYYVSAVGGLGGPPNATQPVQTELQTPQSDIALFRVDGPSAAGTYTMKTYDGHFLTALGGGGKANDAFHTDATKASTWEYYYFLKCGDLGSGYQYAIRPTGTGMVPGKGDFVSYLTALGGGGRTSQAMTAFSGLQVGSRFKLIKQNDGTYALQTSSGNYVTAVNGGGLASGDNLHTDAHQVQAWEKFKIVEQPPNCSYTIQTVSGFYLAVGPGSSTISTRISDPNAAPSIGYNAKFELIMIGL